MEQKKTGCVSGAKREFPDSPRIFCVGWQKTGTSSLGSALRLLGYRVMAERPDMAEDLLAGNVEKVLEFADDVDALEDLPWAALFRELDGKFPCSRFILTYRDEDAWLVSAKKHFGSRFVALHKWAYGVGQLSGNEEIYLSRYRQHNQEVREYFANRPDDLLELSLDRDDWWERLGDFLQCEVPSTSFPHANKSEEKLGRSGRIWSALKGHVPPPLRRRMRVLARGLLSIAGRFKGAR